MTSKDLKADLQADLLIDLATPVAVRPAPPEVEPAPLPPELSDTTPALSMRWTPLRWSRPRIASVRDGMGKAVKLGPLTIELSVKE
jgi:hypothetical protein